MVARDHTKLDRFCGLLLSSDIMACLQQHARGFMQMYCWHDLDTATSQECCAKCMAGHA